jgi:alpha-tubulin suppressor-like RCC1 family protein
MNKLTPTPLSQQNSKIIDFCSGAYHTMMLKSDGKVYSFGRNLVKFNISHYKGGATWKWSKY